MDTANAKLSELQERLASEYVARADYTESQRQISALNETVALLSERAERFRGRWLDAQRVYDAFIQDCREVPNCAKAMELD